MLKAILYVSIGVAITLVVYDWILVAHDEAMTIWQSRWTVPKTLYYYVGDLPLVL